MAAIRSGRSLRSALGTNAGAMMARCLVCSLASISRMVRPITRPMPLAFDREENVAGSVHTVRTSS